VAQTFTLGSPVVLDGAVMEIALYQHDGGYSPDNWDLQEIQVSGTDGEGTLGVLSMSNGAPAWRG
jgi:hypothetical protein